MKHYSLVVLRALRHNLYENHKLHGVGRENVKAVHDVCKAVGKFIEVSDIETERKDNKCQITVIFSRSLDFKKKFEQSKDRARQER